MTLPPLDAILETVGEGWRAHVTLDGRDVSDQCVAVGFAGERPIAVLLEVKDADGQPLVIDGQTATVLTVGEITVSGFGDMSEWERMPSRIARTP